MDWERKSLDWTDRDLDSFRYGLRETTLVTKLAINEANSKVGGLLELTWTSLTRRQTVALDNLTTRSDWDVWFKRESSATSSL